jgi:DNA polymerase-3 subunit epsilon
MLINTLPLVFDRDSAIAWSQAVLSVPDVVFLDTETTGLDGDAEIIEIAIVDRGAKVLIDSYVRPTRPIPLGATAINGIFDHHVAGAPHWFEVYPAIANACQDRLVIVYNADYDSRLIHQTCRLSGMDPFDAAYRCAMQAYACYFAGIPSRGRPRPHKLESAARAFSLNIPDHRALGDALACLGVVQGMANSR